MTQVSAHTGNNDGGFKEDDVAVIVLSDSIVQLVVHGL